MATLFHFGTLYPGSGDKPTKFRPKYPSKQLVDQVYSYLRQRLPPLKGVKYAAFVWDGQLVDHHGYHWPSGFWCDMPEGIDHSLSVEESLAIIEDVFGQFAYDTDYDRNNAYAQILANPLKTYGTQPIAVVDKPRSQTGATRLVDSIGTMNDGQRVKPIAPGKGWTSTEEIDKELIGVLLEGNATSICFDNVTERFHCPKLVAGMTAKVIGGRVLGSNRRISVDTATLTYYVTGNNAEASRDVTNRSVHIRLDTKTARPELRKPEGGFRYTLPDAIETSQLRRLLLSAQASIVHRWLDAGAPTSQNGVLAGFRPFQERMSGLMAFVGLNYNADLGASLRTKDPEKETVVEFVTDWWNAYQDKRVEIDTLKNIGKEHFELKALPENQAVVLGIQLKTYVLDRWTAEELNPLLDDNHQLEGGQEIQLLKHRRDARLPKNQRRKVYQLVIA